MPRLSRGKVERIERAQTSAQFDEVGRMLDVEDERALARRRPLEQYVIRSDDTVGGDALYTVERSAAGSKPSHWLIHPPQFIASSISLEQVRRFVPAGFKRLDRRKDDRADVVEVWV